MVRLKKQNKTGRKKRRFIGVTFKCCNVYSRIYIDRKKPKHVGWCPKCGNKLELFMTPTGSRSNFFVTDK